MKKLLLLTLVPLIYMGCSETKQQQVALPEVGIITVVASDLPVYAEYVGQAYGLSDVQVQARVQGLVTGMHFKEGLPVKEGQLLYTIDDLPYQADISEARARLADAETELVRTKSDLDRVIPLASSNALSQRDLDAANAAYNAAKAKVKAAQAGVDNSAIQLGYASVTAPLSGTIGISKVRVGDYVGGYNNSNLNTISDVNQMRIRFSISENDYLNFKERMQKDSTYKLANRTVDLLLSNGTLYPHKATFNIANREIDPATGSLTLEVLVDNPDGTLRPGQYVRVRFVSQSVKGALIIPQRAVLQTQNIYQVYLLGDSNKVQPQVVQPGLRIGESWVINEGIKAGDKVMLLGNKMVRPGSRVTPVLVNDSSNAAK